MPRLNRRRFLQLTVLSAGVCAGVVLGTPLAQTLVRRVLDIINPPPRPSLPTLEAMPTPVSREEWNARPVNNEAALEFGFADHPSALGWYVYPDDLSDIYRTVAIHHTGHRLASLDTMNNLQNLHMDRNRWADIGYHYVIDADGMIYQGRDIRARGASVARHNTGTIGVAVMGNFDFDTPNDEQLMALQTLVNWLTETYKLTHLAGHFEFNAGTECPGQNLIQHLDLLASGADLRRGTDGYVPPPTRIPDAE